MLHNQKLALPEVLPVQVDVISLGALETQLPFIGYLIQKDSLSFNMENYYLKRKAGIHKGVCNLKQTI